MTLGRAASRRWEWSPGPELSRELFEAFPLLRLRLICAHLDYLVLDDSPVTTDGTSVKLLHKVFGDYAGIDE